MIPGLLEGEGLWNGGGVWGIIRNPRDSWKGRDCGMAVVCGGSSGILGTQGRGGAVER